MNVEYTPPPPPIGMVLLSGLFGIWNLLLSRTIFDIPVSPAWKPFRSRTTSATQSRLLGNPSGFEPARYSKYPPPSLPSLHADGR